MGVAKLVKVILVMLSPLINPAEVNSVPANVQVAPWHFVALFAVIVRGFAMIVKLAPT